MWQVSNAASPNNLHASTNSSPLDAIVEPAVTFHIAEAACVDWLPVCILMADRGVAVLIL